MVPVEGEAADILALTISAAVYSKMALTSIHKIQLASALNRFEKAQPKPSMDPLKVLADLQLLQEKASRHDWKHTADTLGRLVAKVDASSDVAFARGQERRRDEIKRQQERAKLPRKLLFADNDLTATYGGDSVSEILQACVFCRVALERFGRGCNLAQNRQVTSAWCKKNYWPAVKTVGIQEVREELWKYCDPNRHAGYTYQGRPVEFDRETCMEHIERFCRFGRGRSRRPADFKIEPVEPNRR
jgi:hypothetical protein